MDTIGEFSLLTALAALVGGYLCGSIPFGLILTRLAGLGDIRSIGSGNIGATNVLRTGNKGLAALTLLLDALKGLAPVLIAKAFGTEAAMAAGFGAFVGHLYPVWLGFRGGKGVATFAGISLGYSWMVLLPFAAGWLLTAFITRYSSLAALVGVCVTTLTLFILGENMLGWLYVGLTALVFFKHRANIARLREGTESRIGQKG
ncbi:MAG: glycerol-3-phosphate 1-O-acyltransferase PlsY [Roseitalea sp.]|jgi:glycerol-3-phosphate acyltransferase PlsY|uniref:glycerol-3-phosphate 1-O-acyltransferase PlsY n=1 Tax=Oceaniradius stylonematis TaxID=2184161 RepID=UPI000F3FB19D|nr:glycerol-3-phosphate 1-O-acyltransferase PlsY [Oceaniradius stylonematis]MBO6553080.1 glycerol-3-phosphate 1-O-acyltransferase PlsY [Roseitalea sp.]MBO6951160.1 glycerol-3-phosphate 1-O-acyltransferase PlsY [Rhizobiaceae bacterium]RNC93815.1 MAG: glycerol-3-phosphate 1-O-acyltransferase PlsY [Oricola sp.]MBO6590853.1 glycerol-3-phosphate 1-O-acyltransferase PlsY [Roseitalea sp.]MBO6599889.1 glycerol-3-phosphate 1-O-acyltransferase PlsY [Roseitalea sp.]